MPSVYVAAYYANRFDPDTLFPETVTIDGDQVFLPDGNPSLAARSEYNISQSFLSFLSLTYLNMPEVFFGPVATTVERPLVPNASAYLLDNSIGELQTPYTVVEVKSNFGQVFVQNSLHTVSVVSPQDPDLDFGATALIQYNLMDESTFTTTLI